MSSEDNIYGDFIEKPSRNAARRLHFTPKEPSEKPEDPRVTVLKKIPLYTHFLRHVNKAGTSISSLAMLYEPLSQSLHTAKTAFQWSGLGLAIIDFCNIPSIYLCAKWLHVPPPISLTKLGKFVYSLTVLGLTIASIALSFIAVPLTITIASLSLGVSILTLSTLYKERRDIKKKLTVIAEAISSETTHLIDLQKQMEIQEKQLESAWIAGNQDAIHKLQSQLAEVVYQFDKQHKRLQIMHDDQHFYELKQIKKSDSTKTWNRVFSFAITALIVIGLALTISFPPVGFAIIALSAGVGAVYLMGRVGNYFVNKWHDWRASKVTATEETKSLVLEENDVVHESTMDAACALYHENAKAALEELAPHRPAEEKITEDRHLHSQTPLFQPAPKPKPASFIVSAKTTSSTSRALCAGSSDVPRLLDPANEPRDAGGRGLAETMNEAPKLTPEEQKKEPDLHH